MNSIIKFFSTAILAFAVFFNSIGNFLGIGDLIPTQPEEPSETAVIEEETTFFEEPTTEYIEPTTAYVEPETEPAATTTLPPQNPVETTAQRVVVNGRYVCFGWGEQEIKDALGETSAVVYESFKDGRSLKSLVYSDDYSAVSVCQLVDGVFSGFYTIDTDAVVTDGTNEYSIASSGKTSQSKLSIKEYKDSHQGDIVYAIYVSYNGFSFRSRDLVNQDGQATLNFYVVNGLRAIHGSQPLEYCDVAETTIRLYSEDMAARGFFDHVSPEGSQIQDRLHAQGIEFSVCAENILQATGSNTFGYADAWYNSHDGHREGMLSTDYEYVGIAFVIADDGTTYGGQNFYRAK
ncbi:MAG: CAP domain-containing protein [Clostridia bacterium]|nr:CAP domain-containing protein [Clostridia bacterium]